MGPGEGMAGRVGPGGGQGLRAGWGRVGVGWQAGWGQVGGGVAGLLGGQGGPGGVCGGGPGGGEAGLVGRRVGWYGPVAVNVNTARKGVCNGGIKNARHAG